MSPLPSGNNQKCLPCHAVLSRVSHVWLFAPPWTKKSSDIAKCPQIPVSCESLRQKLNAQKKSACSFPTYQILYYSEFSKVTKTNSMRVCLFTKSCLALCNPMGYSLPSSSVREISQVRTLEWTVMSFSRGSFRLRDWTQVSCMAGRFFTTKPPGKSL